MNQQMGPVITAPGDNCAFSPEEPSQHEPLIRSQHTEEFLLSLKLIFVPLSECMNLSC